MRQSLCENSNSKCGAGYQPAACYQQALWQVEKQGRPVDGCGLVARPTRQFSRARANPKLTWD